MCFKFFCLFVLRNAFAVVMSSEITKLELIFSGKWELRINLLMQPNRKRKKKWSILRYITWFILSVLLKNIISAFHDNMFSYRMKSKKVAATVPNVRDTFQPSISALNVCRKELMMKNLVKRNYLISFIA